MVNFTEIISASYEWTATVLFRPFNIKKWLLLGFIALMAGALGSGGGNSGGSSHYKEDKTQEVQAAEITTDTASITANDKSSQGYLSSNAKEEFVSFLRSLKNPEIIRIIIIIATVLLIIFIVMSWLGSRFSFIFLEDVIKNDASIRVPFRENKIIGNSLFSFNIVFMFMSMLLAGLIIFMCVSSLIKIGIFTKTSETGFLKILGVCLPSILLFILLIIIAAIIYLIVNDFVLAVMLREKIKFLQAWKKTLAILGLNKINFILYILIKIGLNICASLIYLIVYLASLFGILFPTMACISVFYFIYRIIPDGLQIFYIVILLIIAIPLAIFLIYCLLCLYLPFAIFFRTLSVKFLGRLNPRYNLFKTEAA
ncbi:MAG: hypothetical protein Q8O30_06560 [Candidatus Omnitrophota bacterium]|nr:hypothetical protein [Candidatus Omnitrophota bacterium]